MSILRWLFLGFLAWMAYRVWQRYKATQHALHTSSVESSPLPSAPTSMVKCAHCELHIPTQQAITNGQQWFCCTQHKNEFAA